MRIARAEVIPYALPFSARYVTARGRLDRREMVLLRIENADGVHGWGEGVPLSLRGGAGLSTVVDELNEWADALGLLKHTKLSAPARCAIEIATADLAARELGLPLWQSIGAPGVSPVICNATLVSGTPVEVAADARRWAADGFGTFKLKVGDGDDVAQVRAVREALGSEARIRIDANGAWTHAAALEKLAAMTGDVIEMAEQPVSTLEEMARLRERTEIPLVADESVSSSADADRAEQLGSCDLITLKLSKIGQFPPRLDWWVPTYLSSALDGPVGIAAAAHAAQLPALRPPGSDGLPIAQGLATQRLFASTIASTGCELHGDRLHVPPGPGLGVEIDHDALDHHRI